MKLVLIDIVILIFFMLVFSSGVHNTNSSESNSSRTTSNPQVNIDLLDSEDTSEKIYQKTKYVHVNRGKIRGKVKSDDEIIAKNRTITLKTTFNQTCPESSEDFPEIFSKNDLENGWIVLVILVGIYCFTILAIICDKYFLPCVEVLCEVFNLSQDVAAATFMSIATSTPELFVNIIGTFITKSDIGIGTIVGSSLFNALGVASIGGLAAAKPIKLDWWPLTRDIIIYMCAVSLLVIITWDGYIFWYEGLILFVVYFLYFTVMFNNARISAFLIKLIPRRNRKIENNTEPPQTIVTNINNKQQEKRESTVSVRRLSTASPYGSYMEECHHPTQMGISEEAENQIGDIEKNANGIEKKIDENESWFGYPKNSTCWSVSLWLYLLPIKIVLSCLLPDPKKRPNLFPLTFVMCIITIGINSYVVSWMISLIGLTFKIPDAVLGFTFLAAGGCLPESISITIMSRRGEGSMGVSNSLGANTMNILMSLGLPWFLKTISMGTNNQSYIRIESGSLEYTIVGLIGVAIVLYLTLYFNKFQLRRRVGVILCVVYLFCISIAIISELMTKRNC